MEPRKPSGARRAVVIAGLSGCVGFCLASTLAFGYAKLDAWRGYGENFQLGYVVGYLDAVALSKRHDLRAWLPIYSKPNYERWRAMMNDYFADPANADRSLPDGMGAAGKIVQDEILKAYKERSKQGSSASPSPDPGSHPGAAGP